LAVHHLSFPRLGILLLKAIDIRLHLDQIDKLTDPEERRSAMENALQSVTRESFPSEWAILQHKLVARFNQFERI
jgi:hypothetical protein